MLIQENKSLLPYNTLAIDVSAKYFLEIEDIPTLKNALIWISQQHAKYCILGGGSNILFTENFDGIVLQMKLKGINVVKENETQVLLNVKAGENWHDTVMWSIEQGYAGIENLALIPGTVGAAPIQNIGAYGVEVKDVIECVEVLDTQDASVRKIVNHDCQFGYRDSIFKQNKNRFIVLSVTFLLKKSASEVNTTYLPISNYFKEKKIKNPTPFEIAHVVMDIRRSKLPDPQLIANAGSFFKNPVVPMSIYQNIVAKYTDVPSFKVPNQADLIKIPAGWLIEQSGFKGKRVGNVGMHEKQALVLVNYGKATGTEILNFAQLIVKHIEKKFGITLEMEVNIL